MPSQGIPPAGPTDATPRRSGRLVRTFVVGLIGLLLVYGGVAYVLLPWVWGHYVRTHPSLENIPGITHTSDGIPGDPLNLLLVGTRGELQAAMVAAGWHPADPLGWRSDVEIAEATVLSRPYDEAPVSNLFLYGRKEDLAFEQPVGHDPRQRHHVRFWQTARPAPDQRPVWIGSATFDRKVGLSHTTGQITHHIAADVDAERNHLLSDLQHAGQLGEQYREPDFHARREGRNGGGDPWRTDGALGVGILRAADPRPGS